MSAPSIGDPSRVEIVVFDLGGVVFDFDWRRALTVWSDHSGVSTDDLSRRFAQGEDYQRFERGELTADEYFARLRHELGIDVDLEVIAKGWNAIFGEIVPGITGVIAAVRTSRYRIAALSNTNAAHAATFSVRYTPVLADLGRVLASHELGHRKPERSCFIAACDHLATSPESVLFLDDTIANVTAARELGMQAAHVVGIDDVRAALAGLDLPREPRR